MTKRGIDLLPVCLCVRWIRRSHSLFFCKTLIFFLSNVCYSVFFQSEGKIRYRTRRIIAIVFFLNLPVGISVRYALAFFFCLSCRHSRSFVKECTELLSSCTYTYATHTKVHAISVLLFCKFYLLIILTLLEPMHFFFWNNKTTFI
jgi:hypothetical protein